MTVERLIFYFDTSAIVKRYHNESGTEVVDKLFDSSAILATHFIVCLNLAWHSKKFCEIELKLFKKHFWQVVKILS